MTLAGTSMILPRIVSLPRRLLASYLCAAVPKNARRHASVSARAPRTADDGRQAGAPVAAAEREVVRLGRVGRAADAENLDRRELVAALFVAEEVGSVVVSTRRG